MKVGESVAMTQEEAGTAAKELLQLIEANGLFYPCLRDDLGDFIVDCERDTLRK